MTASVAAELVPEFEDESRAVAVGAMSAWRPPRDVRLLMVCVAAYSVSACVAGLWLGRPPLVGFDVYVWPFLLAVLLIPAGVVLYRRAIAMQGASPGMLRAYRLAWREVRRGVLSSERFLDFAALSALTLVLMATLSGWKQMIPFVVPLSWDARLAALDRVVHLGHDPWRLLDSVLHHAWIVRALDVIYFVLWFQVVWIVFVWQTWRPLTQHRTRYVLTFALCWIFLGTVAALAFASGGPIYYAKLVPGPDHFAPLRQYLSSLDASHTLVGVHVQEWLWSTHASKRPLGGAGLSAMPSLHVAMGELCAIVGRGSGSRFAGVSLTCFSILVLVGSVYFLSHYAIDGYAGILGAHGVWWFAGRWSGAGQSARESLTSALMAD